MTRLATDPNALVIVNEFGTLDGATAFSQDPSLPTVMHQAGVDGPPTVWIVEDSESRAC